MFSLYPDGKNNGGGSSSSSSTVTRGFYFFGQLALIFVGVRLAYVFIGEPGERRKLNKA